MNPPLLPLSHRPALNALEAQFEAHKIAFGPVVFQCVRLAIKKGLLAALAASGPKTSAELAQQLELSPYAVDLLLESCLSAQVVRQDEQERYELDKTGYFVLNDAQARINMDFVHEVCYAGLADLERSLDEARPVGLRHLGDWPTIYQGLSILPEPARSAWFRFDQHYSDSAFPEALPHAFSRRPKRLMDIGANTGKWTLQCLRHDPAVHLTLVDLPVQLKVARANIEAAGLSHRISTHATDLLHDTAPLPGEQDVVWMSQFLSCFTLAQIELLFGVASGALADDGEVLVLDTFWDRQRHAAAAYCLINTSPYFTAMANGNSKIYRASEYIACAEAAGLRLVDIVDGLGLSHSLLRFKRAR